MAVRGFLLGSLELTSFVVMGLAQAVIQIVLLKALFVPNPSLTNLGWISFVGSYTSVIFTLGIFVFRSELRARYDLTCRRRKASDEDDDDGAQVSWKAASQEGLAAMLLDVSAQMSITGGVYTAGAMLGMGAMYQISALQAAFMQYGLQWVYALTYSLRLQGTQMVAAGQYHQFNALFRFVVIYGLILVVTAAATMVPFRAPLAFLQAEQACEYASHKSCVNIFTDVFGGGTSLQGTLQGSTMLFFVPVLAARCFYQLFKAGLYACLDWNFMARIGVVSFAAVFVPAIVVSVFVRTVASIVVAMYLPLLAMAVAFIFRTRRNIKSMLNDQPGPWQQ
ncbi:unnamed protein product [Effrenium voratum]|nr:unnamed protein product [Effrenium voratum]